MYDILISILSSKLVFLRGKHKNFIAEKYIYLQPPNNYFTTN